jgi:hypothetical protein
MPTELSDACRRHAKGDGSWWLYDAADIPVRRVCERCEATTRRRYAPAFAPGPYAMTGEEADIGRSWDGDY